MQAADAVWIILPILLVVLAVLGWVLFARWRAQRLGLPPPTISSFIPFRGSKSPAYGTHEPPSSGITRWFRNKRNKRTAAGAFEGGPPSYEGAGGRRQQRGGFGALDPDEAWDARVGDEAHGYYEDQELGLHPRHGGGANLSAGGSSYQMNLATTADAPPSNPFADHRRYGGDDDDDGYEPRGRQRNRDPEVEAGHLKPHGQTQPNPFDDDVAEPSNVSLRGISPRPINTTVGGVNRPSHKDPGSRDSPTERRSIFREDV